MNPSRRGIPTRSPGPIVFEAVARRARRGFGDGDPSFDADSVRVEVHLQSQSEALGKGIASGGAGDQGLMFGEACRETVVLMPATVVGSPLHPKELPRAGLETLVREVVQSVVPEGRFGPHTTLRVNPAGSFHQGRPAVDTGAHGPQDPRRRSVHPGLDRLALALGATHWA